MASALLKYKYIIVVLAVMLPRLAWFIYLDGNLPEPIRDQGVYMHLAGNLASGRGLSFSSELGWLKSTMGEENRLQSVWSGDPEYVFGIVPVDTPTASVEPGYPLILAGVFKITGPTAGAVFFINCLFMLLGAWAMLKLLEENWGLNQALLGAVVWALYPFYTYYSAYALTESVHISMIPVILLFTLRSVQGNRSSFLAGLSTGILFLVRSTAILIAPIQMLYLLIKKEWRKTLLVATGFMVCCLPLMIRNQIQLGSPVLMPTKGSLNLWMRNHPEVLELEGITIPEWVMESINRRDLLENPDMTGLETELERSGRLSQVSIQFITANPVLFSYLSSMRFLMFLTPLRSIQQGEAHIAAGSILYLPLLLMAIVELIRRRKDGRVIIIASFFLLYLVLHTVAHGGVRYRLPVDSSLILLATLFISRRLGWKEVTDAGV